MIKKYQQFILEHKFWNSQDNIITPKSITEFLQWIKSKSSNYWAWVDTETTGLPTETYEVQLTQVSCIMTKYNFESNKFQELASYDKKIELTPETLSLIDSGNTRIKDVLKFNHYEQENTIYYGESEVLNKFLKFLNGYGDCMLVIQNAIFDMRFLNTRQPGLKFENEVFDTKQMAQLFYLPLLQKLAETDSNYARIVSQIGLSDRDNGLISSSLSKIGPALGINMVGYHDALTDCRLALQMFQGMISTLKRYQDVDISKYQEERIRMIK